MQPNYQHKFWEGFDQDFKLNHAMILMGMSVTPLEETVVVNNFFPREEDSAALYVKVAGILMDQEELENDIRLPFSHSATNLKVYSNNLHGFLCRTYPQLPYHSIDECFEAPWSPELSHNSNDDFSFILGNYARFFKDGAFRIYQTKRLLVLTTLLDRFNYRCETSKLEISPARQNSSLSFSNKNLEKRLKDCLCDLGMTSV